MLLREHLVVSNISLSNHRRLQDFYTSRFHSVSGIRYLCWRVFWAVYHTCWLVAGPILAARDARLVTDATSAAQASRVNGDSDGPHVGDPCPDGATEAAGKWFIYLSHWVYLFLTVQCIMEAAIVVMVMRGKQLKSNSNIKDMELPWSVRVVWLMSSISATGSVMIGLWYWTILHKGKTLTGPRINTHAVAAIYCVLDLFISRKPFRLMHAPYPVLFGAGYTAFSALYQLAGGRGRNGSPFIYPVLDWSTPVKTLVVSSISNFLLIPMVHAALWGLCLMFVSITDRWGGRIDSPTRYERGEGGGSQYDAHVDTDTSSCFGNGNSTSSARCSTIEVSEGSLVHSSS
ncbi:protein rolling stone [Plakobranchus ocellatus]|uniref:Protein rolling stone n=1 Tax=Plakobranchus ocellatus TaxID=259542 RepID=A0AAV4BQZ5_9GAST|nr:protein rolling stone [Plakobranchus ocellatus]